MKITLLLVIALLLGACQKTPVVTTDAFTSIQDAITKNLVLKCDFTDTDGQITTTYIKGHFVRLQGTASESNVAGLIKDDRFYLWDVVKKEGFSVNLNKQMADGSIKINGQVVKSIDDIISVLQSQKDKCHLSPQDGSLLDLPAGVKFSESAIF